MHSRANHSILSLRSQNLYLGKKPFGFSILETLITVCLAVLMAFIAAPSFASLLANSDMKIQSTQLIQSLSLARQTALTQGQIVHVCGLANPTETKCLSGKGRNRDWNNGWMLFTDLNQNGEFDSTDQVVKVLQKTTSTNIVFNQNGRLRFFPNGSARSAGFYLCNENSNIDRRIYLLHSGRIRSTDTLLEHRKKACLLSD